MLIYIKIIKKNILINVNFMLINVKKKKKEVFYRTDGQTDRHTDNSKL